MITPESLKKGREDTKTEAFTKLMQYHGREDTIYLIVEGKDDIDFYRTIYHNFIQFNRLKFKCELIEAKKREHVIHTYNRIFDSKDADCTCFSQERVFFFVDRDLSDILEDHDLSCFEEQTPTPQAANVYVTDSYSIENSLFNQDNLITTITQFVGLNDLSNDEKTMICRLYREAYEKFLLLFSPIMSWILYWQTSQCRRMNIKCQCDNLNHSKPYKINQGQFKIKEDCHDIVDFIHDKCKVNNCNDYSRPDNPTHIDHYTDMINKHGGIEKNIRGKYVKSFFLDFLESIKSDVSSLFPDKRNVNIHKVNINDKNAISMLCGVMQVPNSLLRFMSQLLSENQ